MRRVQPSYGRVRELARETIRELRDLHQVADDALREHLLRIALAVDEGIAEIDLLEESEREVTEAATG